MFKTMVEAIGSV